MIPNNKIPILENFAKYLKSMDEYLTVENRFHFPDMIVLLWNPESFKPLSKFEFFTVENKFHFCLNLACMNNLLSNQTFH